MSLFAMLASFPVNAAVDASPVSDPYVLVASYELESGALIPGEEAVLRIRLECAKPDSEARDIIASYYFPGGGIGIADGSSNQAYVDTIPAGGSGYINAAIKIDSGFTSPFGVIEISLSYSGAQGGRFSNSAVITPSLSKRCSLSVNYLDVADNVASGVHSLFNMEIENTGDSAAYSVNMSIDGDNWHDNMELGSLEPGVREEKEFYLLFNEPGEQSITISFSYKDRNGNLYLIEPFDYTVSVSANTQEAGSGINKSISPLAYAAVILTIFALTVMLIVMIRRRK